MLAVISENLDKYAALARGFFQLHKLNQGHTLFEAGDVYGGEMYASRLIYEAGVRDGEHLLDVTLDFGFLPHSKCTCRVKHSSCQHMAAALLQCVAGEGLSVDTFLAKVFKQEEYASNRIAQKKVEQPRMKNQLVPHADYRQWHEAFLISVKGNRMYQPMSIADYALNLLIKPSDAWNDRQHAALYKLHVLLFVLHYAKQQSKGNYYMSSFYIYPMIEKISELFMDTVDELDDQRLRVNEEDRSYVLGLAKVVTKYGFEDSQTAMNWIFLFRLIWSRLGLGAEDARKEQKRIVHLLDSKEVTDGKQRDTMTIAAVHLEFVTTNNDEKTIRYIQERKELKLRLLYFYDYLELRSIERQWDKLRLWLRFLKNGLKGAHESDVDVFFDKWRHMVEETRLEQDRQEMKEAMVELLPYTSHVYKHHLLEENELELWVDVHLYWGEELDRDELKYVQSKQPEVLLPYYHQMTVRMIETRQREGYKLAVRLMKKLQTIYRKLKREPEFRRYVDMIETRFSRLRALQDELRKGKLIG